MSEKIKVSVITLGCKVSQYESGAIKEELVNMGYDAVTNFCMADYYILNTCAVTNEAEHKSRSYMTKILNKNPNAKILICGCASEHNQEQFLKNPSVIYVSGNGYKNKISSFLDNYINNQNISDERNHYEKMTLEYDNFKANTTSRTRAYLKIQDGCNNFCSYCLIPFVRGRSRSRELCEIVKEAEILSQTNGEIVLTGINMSDYKIGEKLSLGEVLKALSHLKSRIRIGSLEVNVIDDDFLKTLKDMPNFCPQFHLSMQSGCDRILELMNRHYKVDEYLKKVELIRKYFPDASITTDVIVGFPTETEEDFEQTIDTIKKARFFKMHIFPYSSRQGTKASRMKQISGDVKKKRVKILEQLDSQFHNDYLNYMKGKKQVVLTETIDEDNVVGYTENYIKVYLPKNAKMYDFVNVKIGEIYKDGVIGIIE